MVDTDQAMLEAASALGLVTVHGSGTRSDVLRIAGVPRARAVVVAASRDDSAVLITLTARELAPKAQIVASVREAENVHLLRQSGANQVVVSSETAGRLLGMATHTPTVVDMVEDLITPESGLAIAERDVEQSEIGGSPRHLPDIVLGVVRDGTLYRVDHPEADAIEAGDRLLYVKKVDAGARRPPEPSGPVPLRIWEHRRVRIWGVVIPPGYLRWAAAGAGVVVLGMLIAMVVSIAGLFGASPEDQGTTVRATVVTGVACSEPSATETVTFTAGGDEHRARFDGCGHEKDERVEVTVPTGPLPDNLVVHASAAAVGDQQEGEGLAVLLIVVSGAAGATYAFLIRRGPVRIDPPRTTAAPTGLA